MEYITVDNNKLKKYEIGFNRISIMKFRDKVIEECSEVEHGIFEDTYYPFSTKSEDYEFRNVISLGCRNDNNNINYIFKYEYDKYIYPYLVKLINRLLEGDNKSIEEIFNYKGLYDFYIIDLENKINSIINDLNEDINIDEKINKSVQLKDLYEKMKTMLLQAKTKNYYEELQQLISFELIDEIELSDYQKIKQFLDLDLEFNDNIYKVKK